MANQYRITGRYQGWNICKDGELDLNGAYLSGNPNLTPDSEEDGEAGFGQFEEEDSELVKRVQDEDFKPLNFDHDSRRR